MRIPYHLAKLPTLVNHAAFNLVSRRLALCDISDTILVAGAPRSGTTWLLEIFRALPGYKAFDEPLRRDGAWKAGAEWRTYIDPDEDLPEMEAFLGHVLSGEIGVSRGWHFEEYDGIRQLREHISCRKMVVKCIRIARFLHWFARRFEIRGIVFTIRHPCAVVSSMLNHGNWTEDMLHGETPTEHALHNSRVPDDVYERVKGILGDAPSHARILAVSWCLDYYIPLVYQQNPDGYPWIMTTYERLVLEGAAELQRLCGALGCELTSAMRAQLKIPSSTVRDELYSDARRQLSKWRRNLTERQVEDVLDVVSAFELDFYTRALEPNYPALNKYQLAQYRW